MNKAAELDTPFVGAESDASDDDLDSLDDGSNLTTESLSTKEPDDEADAATAAAPGDEEPSDEGQSDSVADDGSEDAAGDDAAAGDTADAADKTGDAAAEGTTDDDAEGDESARAEEHRIPKSRFDQVNQRRKDAEAALKAREREIEELRAARQAQAPGVAQAEAASSYDFDSAEAEYVDLILDGDKSGAAAKRAEIDAQRGEAIMASAKQIAREAAINDRQQVEIESLSRSYEERFAEFDPGSDDYDEVLVEEFSGIYAGLVGTGRYSAGQAFAKAADMVAKSNELQDRLAAQVAEPAPAAAPAPVKKVGEKVKAAQKAPPSIAGAGISGSDHGATRINIDELTDEELDALPESKLAILRGDKV